MGSNVVELSTWFEEHVWAWRTRFTTTLRKQSGLCGLCAGRANVRTLLSKEILGTAPCGPCLVVERVRELLGDSLVLELETPLFSRAKALPAHKPHRPHRAFGRLLVLFLLTMRLHSVREQRVWGASWRTFREYSLEEGTSFLECEHMLPRQAQRGLERVEASML